MKRSVFYMFLLMGLSHCLYAQTTPKGESELLLRKLEGVLFPANKNLIKITDIVGCENEKLDSVYLIRQEQPKPEEVLNLLKAIAFSKDTLIIAPLMDIYKKHVDFFKKEWEQIHNKNFYACDFADNQFEILSGFEEALHSLYFYSLNLSSEDKYKYHVRQFNLNYQMLKEQYDRSQIIEQYKVFSPYYKRIKRKYWFGFRISSFDYMSPYFKEIQSFLVQDLRNFQPPSPDIDYDFEEYYIIHCIPYFQKIDNETIDTVIMQRYEIWADHDWHSHLYRIAGDRKSSNSLLMFLTDRLINKSDSAEYGWNSRNLFLGYLCRSTSNKEKIRQYLFKEIVNSSQKNKVDIFKYLKQFRDQETLDKINVILKKEKLTDEEKEEAKRTKDFISNLITSK